MNLLTDTKRIAVMGAHSASQTDRKSAIVDMAGYESCLFRLKLGTMLNNGTVNLRVAQSDTNDTGDMVVSAAATGVFTSDGTDNIEIELEVVKPMHRYLEAEVVLGGANTQILGMDAILSGPRTQPTEQPASVVSAAIFQSPSAA